MGDTQLLEKYVNLLSKLLVVFFNISMHNFLLHSLFSLVGWFYDFTVHCLLPSSLCGNGC